MTSPIPHITTDQGLPDKDITDALRTDPRKNLIRDPSERNIPKLNLDDKIFQRSFIQTTNLDDKEEILQPYQLVHQNFSNQYRTPSFVQQQPPPPPPLPPQHQVIRISEDDQQLQQPVDEYWKKQITIDDEGVVNVEPIEYDKNTYDGPFGLSRKGSFAFYFIIGLFTLLSAVFLIMTGVFYGQNSSDTYSKTGILTGLGICAFCFYLGLQLLLIAIWHQKYRRENPIRRIHTKPAVHNDSTDYLKTSMETNETFDYSYQQPPPMDYAPYGYYSTPTSFGLPITEQLILQQPGAATGAGHYDPILWPSNVTVETQPDPRFFQPMEKTLGLAQKPADETASSSLGWFTSGDMRIEKAERIIEKPVEVQPSVREFDSIQLNSHVIEQPLPVLPNAPETTDLIQTFIQREPTLVDKSSTFSESSSKKKPNRIRPMDNKTDLSSSTQLDRDHDEHDHHHHHRHHHRSHSRSHHHHHHHHRSHSRSHHHRHRHHSHSHSHHSHHSHHDHHSHHHHVPYPSHMHHIPPPVFHHSYSIPLPRTKTPPFPRILTPHTPKSTTKMFRETAVNTGTDTKIMRDSCVTANLEDVPNPNDNRLDKIPIVRRTIIVEPYPAQPSSQIIVKPRADMIGKISLSRNPNLNDKEEALVYPTNVLLRKQKLKKKKRNSTIINNNVIEDLDLEDIDDEGKEFDQSLFAKNDAKSAARKTIKNAFYN